MKWLSVAKLIRAPAGLTAVSNILAAAIITTQGVWHHEIALLILASVSFYFSGMVLNDCFDYQEDLLQRPNRPIPSKDISLQQAWLLGFSLMAGALVLTYLHSTQSFIVGIALSLSIVLYNGVVKNGLLGSSCMASCRYVNWLLGASILPLSMTSALYALPIFFYITGLTYLSKQETTAEDKKAVYVCATLITFTLFALVYIVNAVSIGADANPLTTYVSYAMISIWAFFIFTKLWRVFHQFSTQNIQQLITFMVIGVIPLDALLVALSGHYLYSLLVLLLLPPCRMLNKYLYVT